MHSQKSHTQESIEEFASISLEVSLGDFTPEKHQQNILKLLGIHGLTPTSKSQNGLSPILASAREGDLATIKNLICVGASIDDVDHQGNGIFHYACSVKDELDHFGAVRGHCEKVMEWIVKNGGDVNQKNKLGQSAIFNVWQCLDHEKPSNYSSAFNPGYSEDGHPRLYLSEIAPDVLARVNTFECLGGDIYQKDANGLTFLDIMPQKMKDDKNCQKYFAEIKERVATRFNLLAVTKEALEKRKGSLPLAPRKI